MRKVLLYLFNSKCDYKSSISWVHQIEHPIFEIEKYTNYAVKLIKFGGGLFKSMMSVGMEGSSYYIMFRSLKTAITEFFTAIYIYKRTMHEAEEIAQRIYKYCYLESLGL